MCYAIIKMCSLFFCFTLSDNNYSFMGVIGKDHRLWQNGEDDSSFEEN